MMNLTLRHPSPRTTQAAPKGYPVWFGLLIACGGAAALWSLGYLGVSALAAS